MSSSVTQFKNLVKSWNLDMNDVKLVANLPSFHEVQRAIYQRNDTEQYILIAMEDSYRDGVDDFFSWSYITENRKNELIKNELIKKCKL